MLGLGASNPNPSQNSACNFWLFQNLTTIAYCSLAALALVHLYTSSVLQSIISSVSFGSF